MIEEKEEPKLLLAQNPYWCLEEGCKRPGPYINNKALCGHFKVHHIKKEEYAQKHKTDEWIKCALCKKEIYRRKSHQTFEEGNNITCCSVICSNKYNAEKIQKAREWYYLSDGPKKTSRKSADTMLSNGMSKEIGKKVSKWCKDNPEKKKEANKKGGVTRRTIGLYEHDRASERNKKGWANSRINGTYESRCQAAVDGYHKAIENGNFQKGREKATKTLFEHFGIYSSLMPKFSLDSQDLFVAIDRALDSENIKCYYATKDNENRKRIFNGHPMSGEFFVKIGNQIRFLDFYIPELKKCIEYYEKAHENKEAKKSDLIRESEIRKAISGIDILIIREDEYIINKEASVQKCINFIYQVELEKRSQLSTLLEAEHQIP